jgi:hypothetical protein
MLMGPCRWGSNDINLKSYLLNINKTNSVEIARQRGRTPMCRTARTSSRTYRGGHHGRVAFPDDAETDEQFVLSRKPLKHAPEMNDCEGPAPSTSRLSATYYLTYTDASSWKGLAFGPRQTENRASRRRHPVLPESELTGRCPRTSR